MYRNVHATTLFDKWVSDTVFLTNLNDWIEAKSSFEVAKAFRRYRAMSYFTAVRDGGKDAFFNKGGNK